MREREEEWEKWEMVSEDINATMNYSIMSTRSVITHTHTHTHTHSLISAHCSRQAKAGVWRRDTRTRPGLSMTNQQIICSIRAESRCTGRFCSLGWHCCGPNNRRRENTSFAWQWFKAAQAMILLKGVGGAEKFQGGGVGEKREDKK